MGLIFNMLGIIGLIVILIIVPILFYIMVKNFIDKRKIPKEVIERFEALVTSNRERRLESYETTRKEAYDPTKENGGASRTSSTGGGNDGRTNLNSTVEPRSIPARESKTDAKHRKRIKLYKYEPSRS